VRTGFASTVKGTLKTAEFNIYVRDRQTFVRFASKPFACRANGQKRIPVVSSTRRRSISDIYRIGDRNLSTRVIGADLSVARDR